MKMSYNVLFIQKEKPKIYGGVIIIEKLKMVINIVVNGEKMRKHFKD